MRLAAREFVMTGAKPAAEAAYGRVGGAPVDSRGEPWRAPAERPVWLLFYREVKMPVIGPLETTRPEVLMRRKGDGPVQCRGRMPEHLPVRQLRTAS